MRVSDLLETTYDAEDNTPLKVIILNNLLSKGTDVWLNIMVPGFTTRATMSHLKYPHVGPVTSIGMEPVGQAIVDAFHLDEPIAVIIQYVKQNAGPDYKGHTHLILDPTTFDDLYTLKRHKKPSGDVWEIINRG
jgi:hypothetical protein